MKTPTTLIIMDGFGIEPASAGNAVANTATPNLDKIFAECPGCKLSASGLDVGLPEFKSLNVPEESYERIAEISARNISTESNPRPMAVEDYIAVLRMASK